MWELVLYADGECLEGFPRDLFFDRDLIWHQQHFGLLGQVATADLFEDGDRLFSMAHLSDLVQRIPRRREFKTQIEKRFHGWDHLVLNGILHFALRRGVRTVLTPSASLALRNTDPARSPQSEFFDRVYDRHPQRRFRARRSGEWWAIDVAENRDRILDLKLASEPVVPQKVVCLCHDVEQDLGHREIAQHVAPEFRATAPRHLASMLRAEANAGVRATYNVVGTLIPEVSPQIVEQGHSIGFHSFDHRRWRRRLLRRAVAHLRREPHPREWDQLGRCRLVDYRIRGYRPPQSRITPDLREKQLCLHNFEWLASSASSLRLQEPAMQRRVVKIPVLFDDFAMFRHGVPYETWERRALETIDRAPFAVFSLHDCYGSYWLPHYERFLDALRGRGTLKTLDEVADGVILRSAWDGSPRGHRSMGAA
jgi:peptidoglycan/xylan/chitin deacetylase (PgdA/CDA1 family)